MPPYLERLDVVQRAGAPSRADLVAGDLRLEAAIGRSGVVVAAAKTEGDGATPLADLPLRRLWYRADRVPAPVTGLPSRPIEAGDLWCNAPEHADYNRPVKAPFSASHEVMARADAVYDYVIELGWNDAPVVTGRGSAIFLHLAREGYSPTEGCVAVSRADMEKLLPLLGPETVLVVR